MTDATLVVGYAETPVTFASGRTAYDLGGEAYAQLLQRTGIDQERIDGFCATAALSEGSNPFHAAYMCEMLGLEVNWLNIASIGGASFLQGVGSAMQALQTGQCEVAVIVGADAPSTDNLTRYRGYRDEFQVPTGLVRPPGAFALMQSAYAASHGIPDDALAKLVVEQRTSALGNPHTVDKLRKPLTLDDYHQSRIIAPPLRLLDSVMFCDGANAVMLMQERTASRLGITQAVRIAAYAERSNHGIAQAIQPMWRSGFEYVGPRVMQQSGLSPDRIEMLQLYDDFTIALLLQLEQLGFCGEGQGRSFVLSTDFSSQSGLPFNTGGGQLSVGQPGLASGGLTMVEAVRQMFGDAGDRQAKRTNNCLVTGIGGIAYARNWIMSNAMVLTR